MIIQEAPESIFEYKIKKNRQILTIKNTYVFVEGDNSNSSFVFTNWEILDESDDVFPDVLKDNLVSCFGNVENDVRWNSCPW